MKRGVLIVAFVAALLLLISAGTESKKIVFASDVAYAPMEFIDEDGEMVGFDIDLLAAMAEAGGFEYEIRNTAWSGIFAGLSNGAYDAIISSVTITEERKATMDFTDPYINAGQVIVSREDYTGEEGLSAFEGQAVGVQLGTTADVSVSEFEGIEKKAYDTIPFAFQDLLNGAIEAVVVDSVVAAEYVSANPAYEGKLKVVGEPFTEEFFGIAVSKGNQELLDLLNAALADVIASGKRDELIEKWLR
jgi:polar amino acid transport system substrate-binding protein